MFVTVFNYARNILLSSTCLPDVVGLTLTLERFVASSRDV
jgi:hypothetical protein